MGVVGYKMNIKEAKKRGAKIIRRTVEYVAIMPDGTHFVIMPETHYEFLDFKRKTENEQLRKERDELRDFIASTHPHTDRR